MDAETLDWLRRNSGLRIDAEGLFLYHDQPVDNVRVHQLFHRGVEVRGDGAVTLTVGSMWCYVEVDKVARFVDGLEVEEELLVARIRGAGRVACPDPRLGFAPDGRFYLWDEPEAFPAILTRAAHPRMVELIRGEHEDATPHVPLNGTAVAVEELARTPGPADRWSRL